MLKNKVKPLLLNLGRFLQTDIKYVIIQGSWLASGQIINAVISVGTTLAFANLLSPSVFGSYKYVLSLFGIFALSTLPGFEPAVIKTVASGFENVYRKILLHRIKWGFLGSLAALATAAYYFYNGNSMFGNAFIISAIAVPFFDSVTTYHHILAGKKRFDLQAHYYSLTRIFSAIAVIVSVFLTESLSVLLIAYFAPYAIFGFIFGAMALKKLNLNNKYDPGVMSYGKHFSIMSTIGMGVNYLDGIIIYQFLGPASLAIYSIALAPINRMQAFFGIIPEISLPKFAERSIEEIKTTIMGRIFKSMMLISLIIAAYIIAAPFLFRLFFPQYVSSTLFTQILALSLIAYPFVFGSRIRTVKISSVKALYAYNIIESSTQLAVMLYFVSSFGLMGAVMGRVLLSVIGAGIQFYFIKTL